MLANSEYENAWRTFPTGAPKTRIMMHHIMNAVVLHTGTGASDIKSCRRTGPLVSARHLFCYLARVMTPNSYPQIGKYINRDHTTVINSVNRIERLLKSEDPRVTADVEAVKIVAVRMANEMERAI